MYYIIKIDIIIQIHTELNINKVLIKRVNIMDTKTLQKLFFFSLSILLVFFCVCSADAADWTIVTVDSGDVGWYTSIALDNDNPRISYHESTNQDLQYTWCDADCDDTTNWGSVIVDSSGDVGRHSSLYDSNGNPHISYYDETTV